MVQIELDDFQFDTFVITPERIREIVRSYLLTSGPGLHLQYMPSQDEVEVAVDMARHAVEAGQVIDFGYWPNEMIQDVAKRSGHLYNQGALVHPFTSPYIILHTWDDAKNPKVMDYFTGKASACYLVNPFPNENINDPCIDFECVALEGLIVHGKRTLNIGDRLVFFAEQSRNAGNYCCDVIPMIHRFISPYDPDYKDAEARMGRNFTHAAAANLIDPVMVALTMLGTRGVPVATVAPPRALAKARQKAGKAPLPVYRRVDSREYVTAILQRHSSRERVDQGGHHASPVVHIRRGHWRHYRSGERSFIRDTLVNATPEMRGHYLSNRTHYTVKSDGNDAG